MRDLDGSSQYYLDLALVNPDTTALEACLREELNRKCANILHHDYPVQVIPGGIIRICWRNHGGGAFSTPKSALGWLKRHVKLVNTEASSVDLSSAKTPEELNAKVLQLLQRGDDLAAIALVRTTYACSTTEAKAYVDQLKASK